MSLLRCLLPLLAIFAFSSVSAQTDTIVVGVDKGMKEAAREPETIILKDTVSNLRSTRQTEVTKEVPKDPERLRLEMLPRKAVRKSAIIPGWGQLQNRRWWKVPIIYGGFVGMGLAIDFNQRYYKEFLSELRYYNENQKWKNELYNERQYPYSSIVNAKDFYRRNRDLSILLTGALYAVNLIDAYVDAKFFRFDISNDLSLKVSPSLQPTVSYSYISPVPAFKIKLSL